KLGETHEHVGVHDRNHAVQPALRQRFLDVEHERLGLGETSRFDHNPLGRDLLDNLVYRSLEFGEQRATNAAAAELRDAHVLAFNHFRINCDLAELIHHNRDSFDLASENMTEQGRLTGAEWADDKSDRCTKHFKNDEERMTNAELMTKHELQKTGVDALSHFGFRHSTHPFTFPIGVNRATGLLIPANSVAAITSSMSL